MGKIVFFDVTDDEKKWFTTALGHTSDLVLHKDLLTLDALDPETEVLSVFVTSHVLLPALEKLPKLKLIACRSTGFDNVDLEAAKKHGIKVVNVPTYGTHTVAEYAFGLLLTITRKLPSVIAAAQSGKVDAGPYLQGTDLNKKTLGIVGAGRIGISVAQIARAFNMTVVAFDKFPRPELAKEFGFEYVDLKDLLQRSDVISMHAAYTPESHHMLNDDNFAHIKNGAIIINTARGELIDSRALIKALEAGRVGGAALDVLEGEQLLSIHEELLLLRQSDASREMLQHSLEISLLQKMPNVIITHHNAYNTREAVAHINQTTVDNIQQFLAGTPVNEVK